MIVPKSLSFWCWRRFTSCFLSYIFICWTLNLSVIEIECEPCCIITADTGTWLCHIHVSFQISLTAAKLLVYPKWTLASGGCHAVWKIVERAEKRVWVCLCHKYLSNIPINIPHLGPTLTSFMTSLYDVFSHNLPFITCFLSGTQGEQQRFGWMNIKTFTMLPSPLQETSLMESRCYNVWPTDDGIIKGGDELLFYVISGLALYQAKLLKLMGY